MSDFGDVEPEDSWDPDDPLPVGIDNLYRRLVLLGQQRIDDDDGSEDDQLDEIAHLLAHARLRDDLTDRDQLRIRHTLEDLAVLRDKLN